MTMAVVLSNAVMPRCCGGRLKYPFPIRDINVFDFLFMCMREKAIMIL